MAYPRAGVILRDHGLHRAEAGPAVLGVPEVVAPPAPVAGRHAGPHASHRVIDRAQLGHGGRRLGAAQSQGRSRSGGRGHDALAAPDGEGQFRGGDPVSVPPVDDGLGREQRGDRLAAVADIGELAPHQAGQDPAPPVGGQHADRRDPARGERPAGDRQRHREGERGPDDVGSVEGGQGAVEFEDRAIVLEFGLGRIGGVECLFDNPVEGRELTLGDGADRVRSVHAWFSTGRTEGFATQYRAPGQVPEG
jgi:hypothetical protein